MKKQDLSALLAANTYPGRGIVLGQTPDGTHAAIAYFIMGRSVNSRNRIFVQDGDGLRTQAHDSSKLADPSLVIYAPVRVLGNTTIVTNGDQTDTVYDALVKGETFEDALRTRTFEPDPPIYTPRISGVIEREGDTFSYKISILKSNAGNPDAAQRFFFDYAQPVAGEGHLIHTYLGDGNPVPSFEGEPVRVNVSDDLGAWTEELWQALNAVNKVSLFTRFIRLTDGTVQTRIVNKNQ